MIVYPLFIFTFSNRPRNIPVEKILEIDRIAVNALDCIFINCNQFYVYVFSKNETHRDEKLNSTIDYPSGQDTVIQTLKEIASRVR